MDMYWGGGKLMTGICIPNEKMYLDPRVRKVVLDNFRGIAFAGLQEGEDFYSNNKSKLCESLSLNGAVMDSQLRAYVDEPISNPNNDNKDLDKILKRYPNAIIGELEKKIMLNLAKKYPNANFTYTAYQEWWFKIFECRIYKWWTDQRGVWDWMGQTFKKNFTIGWINLTKNNNVKELIQSCKYRGIESWIYVEFDLDVEQFLLKIKGIL